MTKKVKKQVSNNMNTYLNRTTTPSTLDLDQQGQKVDSKSIINGDKNG